jgi:hypothetical protein
MREVAHHAHHDIAVAINTYHFLFAHVCCWLCHRWLLQSYYERLQEIATQEAEQEAQDLAAAAGPEYKPMHLQVLMAAHVCSKSGSGRALHKCKRDV